jgi:hypothetical protein
LIEIKLLRSEGIKGVCLSFEFIGHPEIYQSLVTMGLFTGRGLLAMNAILAKAQ